MQAELAPQHWIGRPELLHPDSGRQWLEGFLQQFAGHLLAKTPITDLGSVSLRIEEMLPSPRPEHRTPMAALYCLYQRIVPTENRSPKSKETINCNRDVLASPSVEALFVHLILEMVPTWGLDEHKALLDRYFAQRSRKSGFRAPELFEAGVVLALAERYRAAGEPQEAKNLLSFAADNALHFPALSLLEREFDPEIPIDWGLLVPSNPPPSADTNIKASAIPEPVAEKNGSEPASVNALDMPRDERPPGDASGPSPATVG